MFNIFKKTSPPRTGPDFSSVDSVEKAQAKVATGDLVKLHLLPEAFGGDDAAHNTVYVPPFVQDIKDGIDRDTVMPLAQQGKVARYAATPRYQGRSVVPISIDLSATGQAQFEASIAVWGEALEENRKAAH